MREMAKRAAGRKRQGKPQRSAGMVAWTGVLALAGTAISSPAQAKPQAVPDAQVESSVLQALAKDPSLAGQQISSTTVYGVVTLTGSVPDETIRSRAEDVVARTAGVTKVVDELTLGATAAPATGTPAASAQPTDSNNGMVLQSDGTYAPADSSDTATGNPQTAQAPVERGAPDQQNQDETNQQPAYGQQQSQPGQGAAAPDYGQNSSGAPGQGGYPQQGPYGQPQYPQQPPYGGHGAYGPPQAYNGEGPYGARVPAGQGQQAGVEVTVPQGTVLQLRVNQPIDSRYSPVGSTFSGVLQQDVVVAGYIALPRGALVQGTVVDASHAGLFRGRAELGLQLSQVTLGGQTYPINSNLWSEAGGDKAVRTVNSALGLGALGAIIGGVAGGGAGAAIGAGAGGAAGLGASAASSSGSIIVPPESLLTFHLVAPLQVATVAQSELNRLAYNVPGYGPVRMIRRYPGYYPYGPGYYYPRYYRPYPY